MLNKIQSSLRQRKLNFVKPFGPDKTEQAVEFILCAQSETMARALANVFSDVDQVAVIQGDIFNLECDALVSPANSFGEMSGGLDKGIDDFYEGKAQPAACEAIATHFMGELPVGSSLLLDMQSKRFPWLFITPTMRIPGNVANSINAYLAMRGLLVCLAMHNRQQSDKIRSLAIPALCTGVGGMNETESARQMRTAFDNVVLGQWQDIKHPAMAPYALREI